MKTSCVTAVPRGSLRELNPQSGSDGPASRLSGPTVDLYMFSRVEKEEVKCRQRSKEKQ